MPCENPLAVSMEKLKIIAFTHKTLDLSDLGKLHIESNETAQRLRPLKAIFGIEEVMILSTCNRIEFLISHQETISNEQLEKYLNAIYPSITPNDILHFVSKALIFEGEEALRHLFSVASSLDSMVVGEREIITQVRNAYNLCRQNNLTGDMIRLVIQNTVECAKKVYTLTNIARNPVSVVSLAYRKLRELHVKLDAKFLIVGAGITNTTMSKYLMKHGFTNFAVFNRSLKNAENLANDLSAKAYPLAELKNYSGGFDVIVTCTGSSEPIITREIFNSLVSNSPERLNTPYIVIDLAIPNDLDEEILKSYDVNLIAVKNLQDIAMKNIAERAKELSSCEIIIEAGIADFKKEFKERKVELAMSEVPKKVKEIREMALNEVFLKDIENLNPQSKETLDRVIAYLEKKYISMPMKMAKEVMLSQI